MEAYVVAQVDEKRASGVDALGKRASLFGCLVGMVGSLEAQSVDYQRVGMTYIWQFAVGNGLHVGYVDQTRRTVVGTTVAVVGKFSECVAENGHLAVLHLNGRNNQVADDDLPVRLCRMQLQQRHAGIQILGKAVRHGLPQTVSRGTVGIDIYFSEDAERAQVVYATDVVVVYVCQQYGIERLERQRHQLLSDVGTAVYEYARG